MNDSLKTYLEYEEAVQILCSDQELCEIIYKRLDDIYYKLSEEDRVYLDSRNPP